MTSLAETAGGPRIAPKRLSPTSCLHEASNNRHVSGPHHLLGEILQTLTMSFQSMIVCFCAQYSGKSGSDAFDKKLIMNEIYFVGF